MALDVKDGLTISRIPPQKVLYLEGISNLRNTAGQWKCIVRNGYGKVFWSWLELPELDARLGYGDHSMSMEDIAHHQYGNRKDWANERQ